MRIGRLIAATAVAVGAALAVTGAGATEAGAPPQSWVGWVHQDVDHHDYSGSPCSEQAGGYCTQQMVEYRIVPATPAVAEALPAQEGERTRLWGRLEDSSPPDRHQGVLTVERVEPAPADPR